MGGGYVLDFSNGTFAEFVEENTGRASAAQQPPAGEPHVSGVKAYSCLRLLPGRIRSTVPCSCLEVAASILAFSKPLSALSIHRP